jgi:hypothetical protein
VTSPKSAQPEPRFPSGDSCKTSSNSISSYHFRFIVVVYSPPSALCADFYFQFHSVPASDRASARFHSYKICKACSNSTSSCPIDSIFDSSCLSTRRRTGGWRRGPVEVGRRDNESMTAVLTAAILLSSHSTTQVVMPVRLSMLAG